MNIATQSYNEIVMEIRVLEERINDLKKERRLILKRMLDNAPKTSLTVDYSTERVTGGKVPLTLDKVVTHIRDLDIKIEQAYTLIEAKRDARDKIDKIIQSSEDVDMRLVYMRDYKKMPLKLIAHELGYSYEHVRRISCRNKKR